MTTARDALIAAGFIVLFMAVATAAAFVVCGLPVLLADWILTTGLPAVQAWLDADAVRGPALLIGAIALAALWLTSQDVEQ